MLLAGDVGGTKTRLAGFAEADGRLELVWDESFSSKDHASLEELVRPFVAARGRGERIERAGFGIAGPVKQGRVQTTNLPWIVDAARLAEVLDLATVTLINDLEAVAYGIAALEPADFAVLNPGAADAQGNLAVVAAGTGLGEAGLYWDGRQHRPFASEGGHADFAPRTEIEAALLAHLAARFGHVSYERVLSGPGLVSIFELLRDSGRGEQPAWLADELRQGDPSAVISGAALAGRSPLAAQALDLFVSVYGAEAGNLALKLMATGGVYVGGGIAPKILPKLQEPLFLQAFLDKGRMRSLLEAIPVRVILNDRAPLLGAARAALLFGEAGRA